MAATSEQYDEKVKKECRSKLIEHAVRCLTKERDTSACVQRDHVRLVWRQLQESGEAVRCFSQEQMKDIEREIEQWELFHESQIQTRKPSDLRVCYLAGTNPTNDLEVLTDHGVLTQNVWAVEKKPGTLKEAWESIRRSKFKNVRLFKGDILQFLKDFEGQFDIIYYDACGTLPSSEQNTLKFIGYVFLFNKLTSPGALITNFSFPPEQTVDEHNASARDENDERGNIRKLSGEYLKYRLCNTVRDDNSFSYFHDERLCKKSDEEIYSDYITYQVVDSAYLYIPAQRMLPSTNSRRPCPLWKQLYVSKDDYLKETGRSDSESRRSSTSGSMEAEIEARKEFILSRYFTSFKYQDDPDLLLKHMARFSYLQMISNAIDSQKAENPLCKAWVTEIFPDWNSPAYIQSLLVTHLLSCREPFTSKFANKDYKQKCLAPILTALSEGRFPEFRGVMDVLSPRASIRLVCHVLHSQMAYPSFPVVDKLLRLRYTAKKRQMFSDVFIFDKCRYVYEQFPSVECSIFAILELEQQMVFRMVVSGLRQHLGRICYADLQIGGSIPIIATISPMGDIYFSKDSFTNSLPKIPERQILSFPEKLLTIDQDNKDTKRKLSEIRVCKKN